MKEGWKENYFFYQYVDDGISYWDPLHGNDEKKKDRQLCGS